MSDLPEDNFGQVLTLSSFSYALKFVCGRLTFATTYNSTRTEWRCRVAQCLTLPWMIRISTVWSTTPRKLLQQWHQKESGAGLYIDIS